MLNVNGRVQKNGGNVASYFCTPQACVIHAVGKPVSGKRLLKEARWAVDTYKSVVKRSPNDRVSQAGLLQQAHLAALRTTVEEFGRRYRQELPRAREEFVDKVQSNAKAYRSQTAGSRNDQPRSRDRAVPAELAARRAVARQFSGDRAHQILAAEPLASFPQVSRRLFEELTGELYAERRSRVYSAAQGLKTARERDMPVLFVFHRGQGEYKDEYDEATKQLLQTLTQGPVALPLKSFIVVVLPLRELAALSNLAKLPAYEFASSRTTLVLARPDGSQVAVFNGSVAPRQLALRLWPLVAEGVKSKADKLAALGEFSDALRSLRKITRAPIGPQTQASVNRHIGKVRFAMAESWAQAGKTKNAIAQFRLVANNTDAELRERALERIAKLQ